MSAHLSLPITPLPITPLTTTPLRTDPRDLSSPGP